MIVRDFFKTIAIAYTAYVGDAYGWRFSVARRASAATSGRVHTGGHSAQRCPLFLES